MQNQALQFAQALRLFSQGAYPQAIALLQQVVAAQPAHLEARLNLAKACLDWVLIRARVSLTELEPAKLDTEAAHSLALADAHSAALVKSHPAVIPVQAVRASVLLAQNQPGEALACLKKVLAKLPDEAEALYNAGYALLEMERYDEAAVYFKRLTGFHPKHGMGWHMLGEATRNAGHDEAALPYYRRAIPLLPGWYQPYGAMGGILRDLGRYDEAITAYRAGLAIAPNNVDLNLSLATCAFLKQDWTTGWRHYACREVGSRTQPFPENYELPVPPGQALRVRHDQGLGDELFFLRFAPQLARAGRAIHYTAHPKLLPLLAEQASIAGLEADVSEDVPAFDVLVGDLPYVAGMRCTADIPPSLTLPLDESRAARLRDALAAFGPGPYLGVTWQGGKLKAQDFRGKWRCLHKEIPPAMLGRLARNWPGTVVVLQRLPSSEDYAAFTQALQRPCLDWRGINDDLRDALAGLSLLDEYVGVSNTNMHLLAGIGKTARVLMPHPPEWRWLASGDESPWFPGFKIYRQSRDKSWKQTLASLEHELAEKFIKKGAPC